MKKLFLTIICFLAMVSVVCAGTSISLQWLPNPETDLAGYRIFQDGIVQTPDVTCLADDSSCCVWTSQDLVEGQHEWYVIAFDSAGNVSEPSNTVGYNVDLTAPAIPENLSITINIVINP